MPGQPLQGRLLWHKKGVVVCEIAVEELPSARQPGFDLPQQRGFADLPQPGQAHSTFRLRRSMAADRRGQDADRKCREIAGSSGQSGRPAPPGAATSDELRLTQPAERREVSGTTCAVRLLMILLGLLLLRVRTAAAEPGSGTASWPAGITDEWRGFVRHRFPVAGCTAWVIEPSAPAPGRPWSWCMEFPDAFTEQTGVPKLLTRGFHHLHLEVGNTFGSPAALKQFDTFYQVITNAGLASRGALIGISRGGLYAYNWAVQDPTPVVEFIVRSAGILAGK